jgi:uncharacterized membrane protein YpjA
MRRPISLIRLILYGTVTWLVPFMVSVPLMGPDGQSVIPLAVFKSLMIIVGAAVGAWMLVRVFRQALLFKYTALMIGLLWLGINIVLDLLVLLPIAKMSLPDYLGDIALRYLIIPIMAVAIDAGRDATPDSLRTD